MGVRFRQGLPGQFYCTWHWLRSLLIFDRWVGWFRERVQESFVPCLTLDVGSWRAELCWNCRLESSCIVAHSSWKMFPEAQVKASWKSQNVNSIAFHWSYKFTRPTLIRGEEYIGLLLSREAVPKELWPSFTHQSPPFGHKLYISSTHTYIHCLSRLKILILF